MTNQAEVLLASINAKTGQSLVTFRIECPFWVWYDLLTHRALSRNASSTRAIPLRKMAQRVRQDMARPTDFKRAQSGMVANDSLPADVQTQLKAIWERAGLGALEAQQEMGDLGASKQDANAVLLPFIHVQAIVSSTQWDNFWRLRDNPQAKPDFALLARKMRLAYESALETAQRLEPGEWHLPMIMEAERADYLLPDLLGISTARCARVSYLLPESGQLSDPTSDLGLYGRLRESLHLSPFEHQAMAISEDVAVANFTGGWIQHRVLIPGESGDRPVSPISTDQAKALAGKWLTGGWVI